MPIATNGYGSIQKTIYYSKNSKRKEKHANEGSSVQVTGIFFTYNLHLSGVETQTRLEKATTPSLTTIAEHEI